MKSHLLVSTAACVLAAAVPTVVFAEAAAAPPVDELVVVASRSPERADRVGQQITVIDAEELEARQTPVLTDIITRTPGISFSRNGGVGTTTNIYIRGAENGQNVVLIDGIKLNDPSSTDTGFNFGHLLVGDVARVEVLRGPQSVLWGSQAIGGVLNLVTAEPRAAFESNLTAEAGSNNWYYGRAGVGGKTDRVTWRATAAYLSTSGVSNFNEARGGRESDGYRNTGATAKAKIEVTDQLSLDLRAVYSHGRTEIDGFTALGRFGDTREYGMVQDLVGYAGANLSLLEGRFTNRAAFAFTRTERKNVNPDESGPTDVTFRASGRNERYEYQGAIELTPAWRGVFGAESERSWMRSASPSFGPGVARRTATINGVYAQLRGEVLPGLTVNGGVRRDDHDAFGDHVVGQASLAWRLNDGQTVVRASWGQGFKAPSLYQLGSEYGNPDLEPETSDSWDAGVEHRLGDDRVVLTAAYFQRRTKNQIEFFSCFSDRTPALCSPGGIARSGFYYNIGRTEAQGLELSAEAEVTQDLTLTANYTWVDVRNRTRGSSNFDRKLARRPSREANLEARYDWPAGVESAVAVRYAGSRFDDAANRNRLKSHVLWDVRASYPVTEQVEIYGRVENLFDKSYETIRNYGQIGRAAYAGVRAKF